MELVERMIEWSLKEALYQKEKLEAIGMSWGSPGFSGSRWPKIQAARFADGC
jgi:hypothetical protein